MVDVSYSMSTTHKCSVLELRDKLLQTRDPKAVLDGLSQLHVRLSSPDDCAETALAYFELSPSCDELQEVWDFQLSAQNNSISVTLINTLAALLRCNPALLQKDKCKTVLVCQENLAEAILKRRLKAIYYHLTSGAADRVSAALAIVAAIARTSTSIAKATLFSFDWTLSSLPKICRPPRWQRDDDARPKKQARKLETRPAFIELGLSFFQKLDADLATALIQNRVLMGGLLHYLVADSPTTVATVLTAILNMMNSTKIQQSSPKLSPVFTDIFLSQLVQLSSTHGGFQQQGEERARILALKLLRYAAIDQKNGLYPTQQEDEATYKPYQQSLNIPSRSQRLIQLLHSLVSSETAEHFSIVDEVISTYPDIACAFLSTAVASMEPECSARWISLATTFGKAVQAATSCLVVPMSSNGVFPDLLPPLKELAGRVCPFNMPKGYLSRGIQHQHPLVQHCSMTLLLRQLQAALHTLQVLRATFEEAEEYGLHRQQLCQMLRQRLPDPGLLMALSAAATAAPQSDQMHEGLALNACHAMKALALYRELLPEAAASARFDPSRSLQIKAITTSARVHTLSVLRAIGSGKPSEVAVMTTETFEELIMLCMATNGEAIAQQSRQLLLRLLNACDAFGCGTGWQELLLLHLQHVSLIPDCTCLVDLARFLSHAIVSTVRRPQDLHSWATTCLSSDAGNKTGRDLPPLLHLTIMRDALKVLTGTGRSSSSRAVITSFVSGYIGQSMQISPDMDRMPFLIAAALCETTKCLPSEGQPLRSLLFFASLISAANGRMQKDSARQAFRSIGLAAAASHLGASSKTWAGALQVANSMDFSECLDTEHSPGKSAAYALMTSKFEAISRCNLRDLVLENGAQRFVSWAWCAHHVAHSELASSSVSSLAEVSGAHVPFAPLLTLLHINAAVHEPTVCALLHTQVKMFSAEEEIIALRVLLFWLERAQSERHVLASLAVLCDLMSQMQRGSSMTSPEVSEAVASALGSGALHRMYMKRPHGYSAELLYVANQRITHILRTSTVIAPTGSLAGIELMQRALDLAAEEASYPASALSPLLGIPAVAELADMIPASCVPLAAKTAVRLLVVDTDLLGPLSRYGLAIARHLLSRHLADSTLSPLDSGRLSSLALFKLIAMAQVFAPSAAPSWWSNTATVLASSKDIVCAVGLTGDAVATLMRIAMTSSSAQLILEKLVSSSAICRSVLGVAFEAIAPPFTTQGFQAFALAQLPTALAFLRFSVVTEDPAADKSAYRPIVRCYRHYFLAPMYQTDQTPLKDTEHAPKTLPTESDVQLLAVVLRLEPLTLMEANVVLDILSSHSNLQPGRYGQALALFQAGSCYLRSLASGGNVPVICSFASDCVAALAHLVASSESTRSDDRPALGLLAYLQQTLEDWLISWISDKLPACHDSSAVLKLVASVSELSSAVLTYSATRQLHSLQCLCSGLSCLRSRDRVRDTAAALAHGALEKLSATADNFLAGQGCDTAPVVEELLHTSSTASLLVSSMPPSKGCDFLPPISYRGELSVLIVALCNLCEDGVALPAASILRAKMASSYGATLSLDDRSTLLAIHALDRVVSPNTAHMPQALQYLWGSMYKEMAADFSAATDASDMASLNLWAVAQKYPPGLWRCALTISNCDEDIKFCEGNLSLAPSQGVVFSSAAYDPRAVVPFVLCLLSNHTGAAGQLSYLVHHGLLSVCIRSLSSRDEKLRGLSALAIWKCEEAAAKSGFHECVHLSGLLQTVITTANINCSSPDDSIPDQLPAHLAVLLAESALVMSNTDHKLYPRIVKLVSQGVGLSLHDLPLFSSFLISSSKSSQFELNWMLRYLAVSIRSSSDHLIYRQRFVNQISMALGNSAVVDSFTLKQILLVLIGAVQSSSFSRHFVVHSGGLLWVIDVAQRHMLGDNILADQNIVVTSLEIFKQALQHGHDAASKQIAFCTRKVLESLMLMHRHKQKCVPPAILQSVISACCAAMHLARSTRHPPEAALPLQLVAGVIQAFSPTASQQRDLDAMMLLDLLLFCRPSQPGHGTLPSLTSIPMLEWAVGVLHGEILGGVCGRPSGDLDKTFRRLRDLVAWLADLAASGLLSAPSIQPSMRLPNVLLQMMALLQHFAVVCQAPLLKAGAMTAMHVWLLCVQQMAESSGTRGRWATLVSETASTLSLASYSQITRAQHISGFGQTTGKANHEHGRLDSKANASVSLEHIAHVILLAEVPT